MIKIPGTVEGVPAIEQCVADGLNINITLLFSQDAYVAVAEAYIRGLEKRAARGEDVSQSASVASFFVSRIDTLVEKIIASREKTATPQQRALFDHGIPARVRTYLHQLVLRRQLLLQARSLRACRRRQHQYRQHRC